MRVIILILSVVLFTSCGNTADTVSDETLDGQYILTEIQGTNFPSDEVTISFNPIGNLITGTTGCNRFSANYHQDGRDVTFTTPISTRKHCEGKMRTESKILSSIEKIAKFRQNGNEYVFLSEENRPLITLTKTNYSE